MANKRIVVGPFDEIKNTDKGTDSCNALSSTIVKFHIYCSF